MHYTEANSYLFVDGLEITKFKAKDSEIKSTTLCLGKVSKHFSVDDMKKTGLHWYVYDFIVHDDDIDFGDILDIQKYLMKKNGVKQCLGLLKKIVDATWFTGLNGYVALNATPLKWVVKSIK